MAIVLSSVDVVLKRASNLVVNKNVTALVIMLFPFANTSVFVMMLLAWSKFEQYASDYHAIKHLSCLVVRVSKKELNLTPAVTSDDKSTRPTRRACVVGILSDCNCCSDAYSRN